MRISEIPQILRAGNSGCFPALASTRATRRPPWHASRQRSVPPRATARHPPLSRCLLKSRAQEPAIPPKTRRRRSRGLLGEPLRAALLRPSSRRSSAVLAQHTTAVRRSAPPQNTRRAPRRAAHFTSPRVVCCSRPPRKREPTAHRRTFPKRVRRDCSTASFASNAKGPQISRRSGGLVRFAVD